MTQQEYENEIKELKERLEKLEATKFEEPQSKRWKPKRGDNYYIAGFRGRITNYQWDNDSNDDWHYLNGNCFKTYKEAEEHSNQIKYTTQYKNYIEEHSEPLDWDNPRNAKYYALIESDRNRVIIDDSYHTWKAQGTIYASSRQIILDAINEIGEDNFKKYVLGVK